MFQYGTIVARLLLASEPNEVSLKAVLLRHFLAAFDLLVKDTVSVAKTIVKLVDGPFPKR